MEKQDLLKILETSKDKNEIRNTIFKLEKYEDEEVIKKIINVMLNIKSKLILEAAQEVLVNFKNKSIIAKEAINLIFSDSPKIRHAGIDILISCGENALEFIKSKLLYHEDFNIRKYALDILKEIKSEKSLKLISQLIYDENINVKYSAVEFLIEFINFKDEVIKIIKDFIKNEKFENLYAATTVASLIIYGHFLDDSLIPIIKEKLKVIQDDNIKHWLYKTLIYLGDREIIEEAKENAKKIGMLEVIENDIFMSKI